VKRERETREQQTFKDPVCGMEVSYKTAAAESTFRGKRYYFCADVCRETFDAAPERYTGGRGNRIGG
jgi:YHS domain-containing protein